MRRISALVGLIVIGAVIGAACSKAPKDDRTDDTPKRMPFPANADTSGAALGDALARFKATAIPASTDTIGMQRRPDRVEGATGIHVVIAPPKDPRHEPLRAILAGKQVIEPVTTLMASSLAKPPTISVNVVSCDGAALAGNIDAESTLVCYEALEHLLHELSRFKLTAGELGSAFVSMVQGMVRHLIGDSIDKLLERTGRDDHNDRTSRLLLAGAGEHGVDLLVATAYWLEQLWSVRGRLMGDHFIDRETAWCIAAILEPKKHAGVPVKESTVCERQLRSDAELASAYLSPLVTDAARARLKLREPPPPREATCVDVGLAAQRISKGSPQTLDQLSRFFKDCEAGKLSQSTIACAAAAKTLEALNACGLTITKAQPE